MERPKLPIQTEKTDNGPREEMIQRLEGIRKNVSSFPKFMPILVAYLRSLCQCFRGGQVSHYWHEWAQLTSDKQILSDIQGIKIECVDTPKQHSFNQKFNKNETRHLQKVLQEMENKKKLSRLQQGNLAKYCLVSFYVLKKMAAVALS